MKQRLADESTITIISKCVRIIDAAYNQGLSGKFTERNPAYSICCISIKMMKKVRINEKK